MNASINVYLHNTNITVLHFKIIPAYLALLCVLVVMILFNVKVVIMDMNCIIMVHVFSIVLIILHLLCTYPYFVAVNLRVVRLVRSMVINVLLVNKDFMSQAVDLKLTTLPQVQEPLPSPHHTLSLLSTVHLAVPESPTALLATPLYVSHVNHPLNSSHQLSAKYPPMKSSQSSNHALMKSDVRNVCNLHLMTVCNVLTLN